MVFLSLKLANIPSNIHHGRKSLPRGAAISRMHCSIIHGIWGDLVTVGHHGNHSGLNVVVDDGPRMIGRGRSNPTDSSTPNTIFHEYQRLPLDMKDLLNY